MKRKVFICGCSRSGTTTFADFLNSHGKIAMGRERYGKRLRLHGRLPPKLFERDRFCRDLQPDDSHHRKLAPIYRELEAKYEDVTYVGDKIPNLFLHFDAIASDYPDAKIIFLLRDIHGVANSHEGRRQVALKHAEAKWPLWRDARNAVKEWNKSIEAVKNLPPETSCLIIDYHRLYVDPILMTDILTFLDLEDSASFRMFWKDAAETRRMIAAKPYNHLTEEHLAHIKAEANITGYQQLLDSMRK